jgi:hypothetical protein
MQRINGDLLLYSKSCFYIVFAADVPRLTLFDRSDKREAAMSLYWPPLDCRVPFRFKYAKMYMTEFSLLM